MGTDGYPACVYQYIKRYGMNMTFSCTYYWQRPDLVKNFIKETVTERYNYMFVPSNGKPARATIVEGSRELYINNGIKKFGNFPYDFNAGFICSSCKNRKNG
jgi:hypothetical protein